MSDFQLDDRGVIAPCPSCGKPNRLAYERLGQPAKCGHCGTAIPVPNEPIEVSDVAAFNALTSRAALPVLVDFWAAWCGPCKMMAPELTRAAHLAGGKWLAAKLDTEALPEPAQRYGVTSIPLLVLFSGGRETARSAGARPAAGITQFVQQHV